MGRIRKSRSRLRPLTSTQAWAFSASTTKSRTKSTPSQPIPRSSHKSVRLHSPSSCQLPTASISASIPRLQHLANLQHQQSWVKASQEVSTRPASCATIAARAAGPTCLSRSACSARPTSPLPLVVPHTQRALSSRRSVSRLSSQTLLFGSVSGCS